MPHKDPERRKQYQREYRQKNKERLDKYRKDRRRNNLEYRLSDYRKGYSKTPIKIRRALIKRANEKCESDNKLPCAGCLGIHHIDENPQNNELSNLQLLCQRHHQQLHTKREKNPNWKGDNVSKEAIYMRRWYRKKRERLEATLCHEYN